MYIERVDQAHVTLRPGAENDVKRCLVVTEAGLPDAIARASATATALLPQAP